MELDTRDLRILRRPFLEALYNLADGDENQCFDSSKVFGATRLRAYSEEVIPIVAQDLSQDEFIANCDRDTIRITRKGIESLSRTIENNSYNILQSVVSSLRNREFNLFTSRELMESTNLSWGEIRDALDFLTSSEYIEIINQQVTPLGRLINLNFKLTDKGKSEFNNVEIELQNDINCFLSSPGNLNISTIRSILEKKKIHVTSYEKIESGSPIIDKVLRLIVDSDIVIGVLGPNHSDNDNVYFELGLAYAHQKNIFLIISPKLDVLPSGLSVLPHVTSDEKNIWAISFAADQLVAFPKSRSQPSISIEKTKPIPEVAEQLLQEIDSVGSNITESQLEHIVLKALSSGGVSIISKSKSTAEDIAVWCDELEPSTGNPIFIEIKKSLSPQSHEEFVKRISQQMVKLDSRWVIILFYSGSSSDKLSWAPVISMQIKEFLTNLKEKSFGQLIFDLRNRVVHGIQ